MRPDVECVLLFMAGTWGLWAILAIDVARSAARPRLLRRMMEVIWNG